MASKRKSPSFEIPDAVRQAGQSGWVYRTGNPAMKAKTTRPSAPLPRPPRRVTAVAAVNVLPLLSPTEPPQTPLSKPIATAPPVGGASDAGAPAGRTVGGWLFGLGLQLAVLPFVVPLYLISGHCLAKFFSHR